MKNIIKLYLFLTFFLMPVLKNFGQAPGWSVDPASYSYSMTYVGVVFLDSLPAGEANDLLAAFIDNECRGVTQGIYSQAEKRWTFYLIIYSNDNDKSISFKYFKSAGNKTVDFARKGKFQANENIGEFFRPYTWASPELKEAKFKDFKLPGQVKSFVKEDKVVILMKTDSSLSKLIPTYETSPGAIVSVNDTAQISGQNAHDFRQPVVYKLLSPDWSTENSYTINVFSLDQMEVKAAKFVSPNADGINDTWYVKDVDMFSDCTLLIFNNLGETVYESPSYDNTWDGTYQGNELPVGTYYFLFRSTDGRKYAGTVSLVR